MNYRKIHDTIIECAKTRNWNKKTAPCYVERHHIIPKSLGGNPSWRGDNVVCLTAKEHYIIHLLLIKMTVGKDRRSMVRALIYFQSGKYRDFKIKSSRLYEKIREEYALAQSEIGKLAKGRLLSDETKKLIGNSSKGRNVGRKHSPEAVEKIRKAGTGRVHSENTILRIKETRKIDWENRKKNGWIPSIESNLKKSESLKEYWKRKKNNDC